jgi:hypothetical protein
MGSTFEVASIYCDADQEGVIVYFSTVYLFKAWPAEKK